MSAQDRLLDGVRVLDLSRLLPGPLASWHLQSAGAHVTKVEAPGDGDYARAIGPAGVDAPHSGFYELLNRGKSLRVIDLKDQTAQQRLLDEIHEFDVLVESFRPGVMQRLGLDWVDLQRRAPRLVQVSVLGYASGSELGTAAGHDINYLAQSGLLHEYLPAPRTADDQAPSAARIFLPNFQWADVLGGAMTAAFAAVCGVLHASRTGKGRRIEVAMTDAMRLAAPMATSAVLAGAPHAPPGMGLLNGGVPCYDLYACADGEWIALGALEHKFWQAFCNAVQRPDWFDQHWQRGQQPGSDEALALREDVQTMFSSQPRALWLARLAQVDCCISPVRTLAEVLAGSPLPAAAFKVLPD
jgi:alpha-methylacyl-CoA racemase